MPVSYKVTNGTSNISLAGDMNVSPRQRARINAERKKGLTVIYNFILHLKTHFLRFSHPRQPSCNFYIDGLFALHHFLVGFGLLVAQAVD